MAIDYPTSLDTLTNPSSGDKQNSPDHASQHAEANDILEELEAKVGVTDSAVTTTIDYFVEQEKLGWIYANQTWTYDSASTITVPAGAAAIYAVGDKIKWTQTTIKYGVITGVADTVLTIAVNTDYVVTNAAITLNFYSKVASPVGYPGWFTYAPAYTGFSADPASTQAKFKVSERCVTLIIESGDGTSNATGFTITPPINSAAKSFGVIPTKDNNNWNGSGHGCWQIDGGTITIYQIQMGTNNFTTSNSKAIQGVITYEI